MWLKATCTYNKNSKTYDFICLFLQAIFKLIPRDDLASLPEDENTAEKRADKLWNYFEKGENGEIKTWTDADRTEKRIKTNCLRKVLDHCVAVLANIPYLKFG